MSDSAFDRLTDLLGEPDRQAPHGSWDAAETYLGVPLPSGYKTFVDRWGPGTLDSFLTVLGPVDGTADEARGLWGVWYGSQPGQTRNHDIDPFPYHPEPGGLIGWGVDKYGGAWFFLAQGPDPDGWPIAVVSDTGQWYATRGTFPEFLLRCLERENYPLFLDITWPRPQPHYLPYRAD